MVFSPRSLARLSLLKPTAEFCSPTISHFQPPSMSSLLNEKTCSAPTVLNHATYMFRKTGFLFYSWGSGTWLKRAEWKFNWSCDQTLKNCTSILSIGPWRAPAFFLTAHALFPFSPFSAASERKRKRESKDKVWHILLLLLQHTTDPTASVAAHTRPLLSLSEIKRRKRERRLRNYVPQQTCSSPLRGKCFAFACFLILSNFGDFLRDPEVIDWLRLLLCRAG